MPVLRPIAYRQSSYMVPVSVAIGAGQVVIPSSLTWTLATRSGVVVNGRKRVAVTTPALVNEIILFGDDLAILEGETSETVGRYLLIEATYEYAGATLPWKREYTFTLSAAAQQLIAPADELSSYLVPVSVVDVAGARVVPVTLTWTLTAAPEGSPINAGAVFTPALVNEIILFGDDLAILDGETAETVDRYLLVEATYTYGGATLPWRTVYKFTLNNLLLAPVPGTWDDGAIWEDLDTWHDV